MIVLRAKINLGLEVVRRRPDGYHDIRTLFQWIDLHDTIEFRPLPGPEIRLSGDDPDVPWDETNLVNRAARPLRNEPAPATAWQSGTKSDPGRPRPGRRQRRRGHDPLGLDRSGSWASERGDLETLARELGADVPIFSPAGCAWARIGATA